MLNIQSSSVSETYQNIHSKKENKRQKRNLNINRQLASYKILIQSLSIYAILPPCFEDVNVAVAVI